MADKFKQGARPSRLADVAKAKPESGLSTTKKKQLKSRGLRLSDESMADLQAIAKAVDNISSSRVTGSDVIRALIHHGSKKMKPEQILQALKDSL